MARRQQSAFHPFIPPSLNFQMFPGPWQMRFPMQPAHPAYLPPYGQMSNVHTNQDLVKKGVDVAIQTDLSGPVVSKAEQVSTDTQTFLADFIKARAKFKEGSSTRKDPERFFKNGTPEHRQYRVSVLLID